MKLFGQTGRVTAESKVRGWLVVAGLSLAGCATLPSDGATASVKRFDNLRAVRYCEVLLIGGNALTKELQAAIYNTTDLNNSANPRDTCPEALWDKIDAGALKKQYEVLGVFKNGPRTWTMDWIELPVGSLRTFGGLQAYWMAQLQLPKDVNPHEKGSSAYKPMQVQRKSVMTFQKDKPVFILNDPQGTPWVMQASSQIVDPMLTYEQLSTLGNRLKLPSGWKYRVSILDRDLTIEAIDGVAHIMQDEFQNTYDECFSTACTYRP